MVLGMDWNLGLWSQLDHVIKSMFYYSAQKRPD